DERIFRYEGPMARNATRLMLIAMFASAILPVAAQRAEAKEICLIYCPVGLCELSYSPAAKACSCTCKTFPSSTFSSFKEQKLDKTPVPILLKEGPDGNVTFLPARPATAADALVNAREESQSGNPGETGQQTFERQQR